MLRILIAAVILTTSPAWAIPICKGGHLKERGASCISDGDTGWARGQKWRLLEIDAPEMHGACPAETRLARQARDRLQALMDDGYRIRHEGQYDRAGRRLVHVVLKDGRDAGEVLMSEGLAQPWPNEGNVWCER